MPLADEVLSLSAATWISEPLCSLLFWESRHREWISLWPLLGATTSLLAALYAFRLRSRALIGVSIVGAVLVLLAVNHSIRAKEQIIGTGELIYLALAPVDPRSLMQGDYMALAFEMANQIGTPQLEQLSSGYMRAPIAIDARRIATLSAPGAGTNRRFVRYRWRDGRVWLGTDAYFFEEGSAGRYNEARFGEFRLDPQRAKRCCGRCEPVRAHGMPRASGGPIRRVHHSGIWRHARIAS